MNQREISRTFHQKGDVVVMQETHPKLELQPRDILQNLDAIRAEIQKGKEQLKNMRDQIPLVEGGIAKNKDAEKNVAKFESWAVKFQESKLKAIVGMLTDEAVKHVDDHVNYDPTMPEIDNFKQYFHQYRQYIATHTKVSEAIHKSIVQRMLFTECMLVNPWKDKIDKLKQVKN